MTVAHPESPTRRFLLPLREKVAAKPTDEGFSTAPPVFDRRPILLSADERRLAQMKAEPICVHLRNLRIYMGFAATRQSPVAPSSGPFGSTFSRKGRRERFALIDKATESLNAPLNVRPCP